MAGKESEAKDRKYVETPLMKQYYSIKAVHGDAVLLFRVGDFYETFGEDAVRASRILGITLTRRANGAASYVELAGFPYHALDTYLPKLVRAGERVAVRGAAEDPQAGQGNREAGSHRTGHSRRGAERQRTRQQGKYVSRIGTFREKDHGSGFSRPFRPGSST